MKRFFSWICIFTLFFSSINVYAIDDSSNIIIEEDNLEENQENINEEIENNLNESSNDIDNDSSDEIIDDKLDINTYSNNQWNFNYSGNIESFIAPETGKYFIEAYGASGGNNKDIVGSNGGYASGYLYLYKGDTIYIAIGGKGSMSTNDTMALGGFNGGGDAYNETGSGGGATSITTTNRGELKNFENYKDEIILVAGGGGGIGTTKYDGSYAGSGGGTSGTGSPSSTNEGSIGGTQTSGYAFGYGQNSNLEYHQGIAKPNYSGYGGAGGGGYYGGTYGIASYDGGGGGSGYISSLLHNGNMKIGANSKNNDGYVGITYIENPSYTLYLDASGGGTFNGNNSIEITGKAGETINLPTLVPNENYKIKEYEITEGDGTFNDLTSFTFGFSNVHAKTIYIAPLIISTTFDKNLYTQGGLNISITQNDENNKIFSIQQSNDGLNWNNIAFNSNNSLINVKNKFEYTKNIQTFIAPYSGLYYIQAYGAAGGNQQYINYPGLGANGQYGNIAYGGYSSGYIYLKENQPIYLCVGGKGGGGQYKGIAGLGGYNGGGNGGTATTDTGGTNSLSGGAGGGGATSITTTNRGELKNFAKFKNEIILVAGGGGGSAGPNSYAGGAGGGLVGGNGTSNGGGNNTFLGGTQTSGYAFGKGENAPTRTTKQEGLRGGGGGYYGGYAAKNNQGNITSGAGGSGYIGGVLSEYSKETIQGGGSDGNGYAIITSVKQFFEDNDNHTIEVFDKENPNMPTNLNYQKNNQSLTLSWNDNGDNGSVYYHRVISYNKDTFEELSTSTPTKDVITSGIKGFYYSLDNNKDGKVEINENNFTSSNNITFDNIDFSKVQYFHILAIDNVGNISEINTIEIPNTINKTCNIKWNDDNNKNGFRPSKYTLKLIRNGKIVQTIELDEKQTSYTFNDLSNYDSNGNEYKYTFDIDTNTNRYVATIEDDVINCNYNASNFNVIIPKMISLNGNTGKGSYNVQVNGTFYYNDTLTVTPSSSFTLKDKSGISTLQANVTQNVTTFTKNNLGTTSGSISLNKTKFAGRYDGTFNFNIKFILQD